jgi:hypothetical protein
VNLIAEDGSKDEDEDEVEDEGWWVRTVGVTEMPDQVEEIPSRMFRPGQGRDGHCTKAGSGCRLEEEPGYPPGDCSADEAAEDEWWGLESTRSRPEEGGAGSQHPLTLQCHRSNTARSPCHASTKRRRLRKRPETTPDQDWEEVRRNAWLGQMLSDTSSDEDEEHYRRFAESGRWMTELFGIPQQLAATSGGECSG